MKINKIEKDVQIPIVHSKYKYPWDEMEVGDSVFFEADDGESIFTLKRRVGPAATYFGQQTGKQFKTLLMREDNGVRVWRLG